MSLLFATSLVLTTSLAFATALIRFGGTVATTRILPSKSLFHGVRRYFGFSSFAFHLRPYPVKCLYKNTPMMITLVQNTKNDARFSFVVHPTGRLPSLSSSSHMRSLISSWLMRKEPSVRMMARPNKPQHTTNNAETMVLLSRITKTNRPIAAADKDRIRKSKCLDCSFSKPIRKLRSLIYIS